MAPTPAAISRLIDYNLNEGSYWGELLALNPSDQEAKAKAQHHHRSLLYWLREYKRRTGHHIGPVVSVTVHERPTAGELVEQSRQSRATLIAARRKELASVATNLMLQYQNMQAVLEHTRARIASHWLIEIPLANAGSASGFLLALRGQELLKHAKTSMQRAGTHMARQEVGLAKSDYAVAAGALIDIGALINTYNAALKTGAKRIELTILAGMTMGTSAAGLAGVGVLETGAVAMAQNGAVEGTLLVAQGLDPAAGTVSAAQIKKAIRKTIMAGGTASLTTWVTDLLSPTIADAIWLKQGRGGPTPSYVTEEVKRLVGGYCAANIGKIRSASEAVMDGKNPKFSVKELLYTPVEDYVFNRFTGLNGVISPAKKINEITKTIVGS